jgi:hypothetical protein
MGRIRAVLDRLPLLDTIAWVCGEAVHRPFGGTGGGVSPSESSQLPLSPYDPPGISNPVLTAHDVRGSDLATFVADPLLLPGRQCLHLFFEVYYQRRRARGVIGHAKSDDGGATWTDAQIVLSEDHHLSFPFVFEDGGERYMLPEKVFPSGREAVQLYRAVDFPTEWELEETLLRPTHNADDTVVFRHDGRWWMVCGDKRIDGLHVYYADSLTGEWKPHAGNPVVSNRATASTPAGRPIIRDDTVISFYQDCEGRYGKQVRAYRLEELTPDSYVETECPESPVLEGNGAVGWRGIMHHIDARYVDGDWICAVDGNIKFGYRLFGQRHWSIGIFKS